MNQIEQGEKKLKKIRIQEQILKEKIRSLKYPMEELTIQYPPNNSKRLYTLSEDRFLLLKVYEHGLTNKNLYPLIKADISRERTLRFSFYLKSRTTGELSRRISTLLLALTREVEGPEAFKRKLNRRPKSHSSVSSSRQSSIEPTSGKHKLDVVEIASPEEVKKVKIEV